MPDSRTERELIRKYVEANFEKAKHKRRVVLWVVSLVIFILLALLAWGLAARGLVLPALILLTVGGGLGVFFHGLVSALESEEGDRQVRRQLVMEARIQQMFGGVPGNVDDYLYGDEAGEPAEKPKRDQVVRLTEDGELEPDETYEETEQRRKRTRP